MNLAEQLRDHIRSYLSGNISLRDVRLWLGDHAQDIADSSDQAANELDGKVWILLSEFDAGYRDESDVRDGLRGLLPVTFVQRTGWNMATRSSAQTSVSYGWSVPGDSSRTSVRRSVHRGSEESPNGSLAAAARLV